jgi:hypothetical protein
MARADWDITGLGGIAIIDDGGSKRCQLSGNKLMLWNGRSNLADVQVASDYKFSNASSTIRGGCVVRSDATGNNSYRLHTSPSGSVRVHVIYKVVNGIWTTLGTVNSNQSASVYVKTRLRVDGWQLSVEEYINGAWVLLMAIEDTSHALVLGFSGIYNTTAPGYEAYSTIFDNVEIGEKE